MVIRLGGDYLSIVDETVAARLKVHGYSTQPYELVLARSAEIEPSLQLIYAIQARPSLPFTEFWCLLRSPPWWVRSRQLRKSLVIL
jgi:hypothetical protein